LLKKFLWLFKSYFWAKKLQPLVLDSIVWSTNPLVCHALKYSNSIIFEKHGQGKWLQKVFIKKLKESNFYLIGTTRTSYEELKKINSKSIYLPNGVDTERFYPNEIKTNNLVVGYSGMLETYGFDKGVLNACKEMLDLMKNYKFKVVIIGGPEYKIDEIKDVIKDSKYVDNFEFENRIPQNQLAEKIRNFDIGLVPYPDNIHTNLYASPLKIFEYLASGVVPLVSDLKAHRELNIKEIVFYERGNFKNFAHVLTSLLDKKAIESKKVKILELQSKLGLDFRTEKIIELLRL
jgi:glycosyltransferase involved in cell wall biosynthesis